MGRRRRWFGPSACCLRGRGGRCLEGGGKGGFVSGFLGFWGGGRGGSLLFSAGAGEWENVRVGGGWVRSEGRMVAGSLYIA